jgi:peptidoglycan/xylan/chitin deacetylase (PgdA/CDA1 family)
VIGALRVAGVLRLFRWLNRNRLVILTYHSVLPAGSRLEAHESRNVVDEQVFDWQMRYLATHYRCVRLDDAIRDLADGRRLPPYTAAVTFDDGFRNNLQYAVPVLRRWNVPATIFVTTGHIGRGVTLLWTEHVGRLLARAAIPTIVTLHGGRAPLTLSIATGAERPDAVKAALRWFKALPIEDRQRAIRELEGAVGAADRRPGEGGDLNADRYAFLTWSEARALARAGVGIGSHTIHHPILSSLGDDERAREVVESKRDIDARVGVPCTLFSYPNGTADDFDGRDEANLRAAGYLGAVSQIAGLNDHRTNRFALRRLNIGQGHVRQIFIAQVSGFWPWLRALLGRSGAGAGSAAADRAAADRAAA